MSANEENALQSAENFSRRHALPIAQAVAHVKPWCANLGSFDAELLKPAVERAPRDPERLGCF